MHFRFAPAFDFQIFEIIGGMHGQFLRHDVQWGCNQNDQKLIPERTAIA